MSSDKSLIDIGNLSRPATVLVEKISEAIGGVFRPYQIRRVARAEASAERIRAIARMKITALERRALRRFVAEESRHQLNMETIVAKAIPDLTGTSRPAEVATDWLATFFEKCRLISDEEMQSVWARVLAGEANSPGRYSKRTLHFLGSLDKTDATLFTRVCSFGWRVAGSRDPVPLIYDTDAAIYRDNGVSFAVLKHLSEIGLLSFDPLAGYRRTELKRHASVSYCGVVLVVDFASESGNSLDTGSVLLSKVGCELALICGSRPIEGLVDHVVQEWFKKGLVLLSRWPRAADDTQPGAASAEPSAPR